jgi:hypothetical protein
MQNKVNSDKCILEIQDLNQNPENIFLAIFGLYFKACCGFFRPPEENLVVLFCESLNAA